MNPLVTVSLPYRSRSCRPAPRRSHPFSNLVFPSQRRSSEWSFPLAWIPLDNCAGPPAVGEPCDVSRPAELTFLVLCDHVLHTTPLTDLIVSNVVPQRESQHCPFHGPLRRHQPPLFPLRRRPRFASVQHRGQNSGVVESGTSGPIQLRLQHIPD